MTFRSGHTWRKRRGRDLDHAEALEVLFEDVLGEPLPAASSWEPVHCINPEHDDDQASASVHPGLGAYRCHACGLRGDAYALAQRLGMVESFTEAVALLTPSQQRGPTDKPESSAVKRREWL